MPTAARRGETYIDKKGVERYVSSGANRLVALAVAKVHGLKNRELNRNRNAKYARNGSTCIHDSRRRAKRKGLPHTITHAYMMSLWPESNQDWTGHPMVWKGARDGKTGGRLDSPTIDMIDPSLGYVEGNVEWLANRTNLRKGAWTPDEMRAFLKHIERNQHANNVTARASVSNKNEVGEFTIEGKRLLTHYKPVLFPRRKNHD